ncbi:holin [Bacillus anthracis]|nr:holin [Bacillus anthracis]
MERIDVLVKLLITSFGGFWGYFVGGFDMFFNALLTLSVIDYSTGVIAAWCTGTLKSKVGFKGIAKKVVLFLLVATATQADAIMGTNSAIREATIFFLVGNELLSILENAGRMGIPLPAALTNAVEVLKNQSNKKYTKGEGQ